MPRTRMAVHALDVPLSSPFRIAYDTVTHIHNGPASARGCGEAPPVPTITSEDRAAGLKAFEAWQQAGGRLPADARDPASLAIPSPSMRTAAEGPLCTSLSGRAPAPVPTSITLGLGDDAAVVPWVDRQVAAGFRILKVKGGLRLARHLARIGAVREAAGPKATLRVDPNQSWSRDEARRALPILRDLGVAAL